MLRESKKGKDDKLEQGAFAEDHRSQKEVRVTELLQYAFLQMSAGGKLLLYQAASQSVTVVLGLCRRFWNYTFPTLRLEETSVSLGRRDRE